MGGFSNDTTALLRAVVSGDQRAKKLLFSRVYDELHALAHGFMKSERPGNILQTTALVHEAYLRLVPNGNDRWVNRKHFFASAARAMRQILIDEARKRSAQKRGGSQGAVKDLGMRDGEPLIEDPRIEFEDLDQLSHTLQLLESNERASMVVEMHIFAGMTLKQIAEVLETSTPTVERVWRFARLWLYKKMVGGSKDESQSIDIDGRALR